MKKSAPIVLAFGIVLLFFLQSAGTLVESIYILDLMNSTLDEKALGVLFFFTPPLLIPLHDKYPRSLAWAVFGLLFLSRGLLPHLTTALRVPAAGLGVLASINLFLLLLKAQPKGRTPSDPGLNASIGLALAVLASAALRTLDHGVDPSLLMTGNYIGWMLGILLGLLLLQLEWKADEKRPRKKSRPAGVPGAVLGLTLALGLVWFAFSAPAVLARWTEGNYTAIVIAACLLPAGWVLVEFNRPQLLDRMPARVLLIWNLLFTLSLTGTILAHSVPFPPAPDSPAVTVGAPAWPLHIPLILTLLLFPVVFLDFRLFADRIQRASPWSRDLVPGLLLGGLALTLLIFANIFTNVWGYVDPVSPLFRGAFWLTYFLMAAGISMLIWMMKPEKTDTNKRPPDGLSWIWATLLGAIVLVTAFGAWDRPIRPIGRVIENSLVVMTFNTQQSNDDFGEKSLEKQLELIRRVSPDILALQETDSTRISLNNNDYVRYFAEKLRYHSYYGPKTVTGTYGTAILSRYPLLNTRTVFTYSDQDEIGTAEAEIEVGGRRFTIYNVHPDGSEAAMLAFARDLLARSADDPYVIALGDFNLRDDDGAYQMIDAAYTNAWTSVFPSEIGNGTDMSGDNRIDHIFVSPSLGVRDPVYILPPDSATDHPVHWAEVYWE